MRRSSACPGQTWPTRPPGPAPTSSSSAPRSTAGPRTGPAPGSARRPSGSPTTCRTTGPGPISPWAWTRWPNCGSPTPGDVEMPSGDTELSLQRLEEAVQQASEAGAIPVILGGDHTIAFPDATGVARHVGWGRLSVIHFDAHADTGDTQFGSLYGHGTPMRRLIESGAVRGDRFLQIGLRGYWPEPETLDWMAAAEHAQLRDDRGGHPGPGRVPDRGVRHRHRRLRRGVPVRGRRRGRSRAWPRAPARPSRAA